MGRTLMVVIIWIIMKEAYKKLIVLQEGLLYKICNSKKLLFSQRLLKKDNYKANLTYLKFRHKKLLKKNNRMFKILSRILKSLEML